MNREDAEDEEEDMQGVEAVGTVSHRSMDTVLKRLDINAGVLPVANSAFKSRMGKSMSTRHANIATGRQMVQRGTNLTLSMIEKENPV